MSVLHPNRRRLLRAAAGSLLTAGPLGHGAFAADPWPSKPIRVLVTFPPGNGADVIARELGPLLSARLGQPVVVENRGGAGGVIGVEAIARATPDGHTIGMTSLSPITIIPALRRKLPYDPVKDIAPIALTAYGPMVLLVKKDSPITSVTDLIARARANPGALTYGSLGTGTISHMTTESFKAAAGAPLTEVPYKGSAQALTDLAGGNITLMFDGASSAVTQVAAGTVRALCVTTLKRNPLLPDVPTLDEGSLPQFKGFEAVGWIGLIAPSGVPTPILERINAEVSQLLTEPSVQQRIRGAGQIVPDPMSAAQFGAYMQRDLARWTKLANDLKIVTND